MTFRHLRQVAVALRQSELASQEEIARAFACSVATLRRWERRYQRDGLDGLDNQHISGRPRRITSSQETCLRRWFAAGLSIVEMARRLSVSTATVDRALRRLRLHQPKSPTPVLPGIEPEEVPATTDSAHAAAAAPSVLPSAGAATDALSDGARADARWRPPPRTLARPRTPRCRRSPQCRARPRPTQPWLLLPTRPSQWSRCRLASPSTRTRATAPAIASWPVRDCWPTPCPYLPMRRPSRVPVSGWRCRCWSATTPCPSSRRFTVPWPRLFMVCAPWW